jgi:hypothetical protein
VDQQRIWAYAHGDRLERRAAVGRRRPTANRDQHHYNTTECQGSKHTHEMVLLVDEESGIGNRESEIENLSIPTDT